ncbi:PEP-CTERM sorting domain-containing protein [Luteolibacter pohnpeiensis]|uniref:PEP-CTERM sorting domain-containing protein n=1 Tax=Luteolibacter pohnpeiensis TaxID=454153 RepID=A0A934S3V2_9BACT|nr:PEP-CTERM sorting domain-containing protein [Luteolibacter pohnpeiensis]MBK1881822.1 PEP-CTERM sorting domain-containing protein [Luteolibacter pohnpeiensis]
MAASLAILFTCSSTSQGAIIVQELFDAIAGPPPGSDASLNGKGDTSTTVGLTGTWSTHENTGIYTASNFNAGDGLPGLPSNAGTSGGIYNFTGGNYSTGIYATRPLTSTIDFSIDQTIYFSYLANNSGDTSMGIGLSSGTGDAAEFVGAGLSWNNARTLATGDLDAGNAAYISYGQLGSNEGVYGHRDHEIQNSVNGDALIVGRIIISSTGADLIDIKRYGVGDTIEADPSLVSWSASDSLDSSMVADHLVIWMNGNSGSDAGELDAIRIGQTWSDVTGVIPEPASAMLLAVGLGFAWRRRR